MGSSQHSLLSFRVLNYIILFYIYLFKSIILNSMCGWVQGCVCPLQEQCALLIAEPSFSLQQCCLLLSTIFVFCFSIYFYSVAKQIPL